ncbi:MAG: hypothetical protein DRG76_00905 [Deltaproteobacteria bacterium]|nr:MAG: hypothetical protein DRG76_00905 [Deltaproteobacteria bacterium]
MEEGSLVAKVEKIKMPYRLLIYFGTLVLLAGLFVWLVVLPKQGEIKRTKKDIVRIERKLNQARIRAKNLKKFKAELKEVDAQFKEALKLLPNEKEIPSLLRSITQLGADSDLTFVLFSPKKERVKAFYVEIPVAMEVRGTYHNVATFFYKVGRMDRIVKILDFSMKPVHKNSNVLLTKCTAMTYRFKGSPNAKPSKGKK